MCLAVSCCASQAVNAGVLPSASADREARDALLAELRRLEAELDRIRHDLQGVLGCRGRCEQLDSLQDTVRSMKPVQPHSFGAGWGAGAVRKMCVCSIQSDYCER